MSGANVVYNKIDGTGAAAILDSRSDATRSVYQDSLTEMRREQAEARTRREDLLKEIDKWSAEGGFAEQQDLAKEQISASAQMVKNLIRDKGQVTDDIIFMTNDLTRQFASDNPSGDRRAQHWESQITAALKDDYSVESKQKLDEWRSMTPEAQTKWEKENGGMPILQPHYQPTLDDWFQAGPLASMKRNEHVDQKGRRIVKINPPSMSDEEIKAVVMPYAEREFNVAHDDPENPIYPNTTRKFRARANVPHEAIVATGKLSGLDSTKP